MEKIGRKMAAWLARGEQRLGERMRRLALGLAGIFTLGYLLALSFGAVRYQMAAPERIARPSVQRAGERDSVGELEARAYIARFRSYMDSLSATGQGRQLRDSILLRHPGILDTVAMLEQMLDHSKQ